jgi:hypothetical protein
MRRRIPFADMLYWLWLVLMPASALAQMETPASEGPSADVRAPVPPAQGITSLDTLASFVQLRDSISKDIRGLNEQIRASQSDAEKQRLTAQLDRLEADRRTISQNVENVAAGVDITSLRTEPSEEFNFQRELFALLKPALDEMKEMTSHVRQKSDLKEKIAYYQDRLTVIGKAIANVERLLAETKDKPVRETLKTTLDNWRKQQTFMQSELEAAQLQLEKLVAEEVSITEASQSYLKSFFQQRGLYLTVALLVVLGILLLSRLTHRAMERYVPGFSKLHRSFRIRLAELIHRVVTVLLVVIGPTIVFYAVEDWVLFSLSLLLLLGIAWTIRQTLPRYLRQIQLFLNIGAVREGERLLLDGLPWQVKQINVFCTLVNPVAELTQRVPIDALVDVKSRPARHDEPWFPCKKGDWVILGDGVRGKVIGISPELVQLVERGGAVLTYQTGDFLAKSPRNLATNFRIKETIGSCRCLRSRTCSGPSIGNAVRAMPASCWPRSAIGSPNAWTT